MRSTSLPLVSVLLFSFPTVCSAQSTTAAPSNVRDLNFRAGQTPAATPSQEPPKHGFFFSKPTPVQPLNSPHSFGGRHLCNDCSHHSARH